MGRHRLLDQRIFHEYLWNSADRLGRVKVNQSELAIELDVNRRTVIRLMNRLIAEDKIALLKKGSKQIGTYAIKDPSVNK